MKAVSVSLLPPVQSQTAIDLETFSDRALNPLNEAEEISADAKSLLSLYREVVREEWQIERRIEQKKQNWNRKIRRKLTVLRLEEEKFQARGDQIRSKHDALEQIILRFQEEKNRLHQEIELLRQEKWMFLSPTDVDRAIDDPNISPFPQIQHVTTATPETLMSEIRNAVIKNSENRYRTLFIMMGQTTYEVFDQDKWAEQKKLLNGISIVFCRVFRHLTFLVVSAKVNFG